MAADPADQPGASRPSLPDLVIPGPSYLVLRAAAAAAAPECYRCFEVRPYEDVKVSAGMVSLPASLIAAGATLVTPETAHALGALVIAAPPDRPSVSLATALFPESVPGFDQEAGLTLPSAPQPAEVRNGRGIRAGAALIQPTLDVGTAYDSNVRGARGSPGSSIARVAPAVSATADYSRGQVGAYVGVDRSQYLDLPRQSRTDVKAALGGNVAIGRGEATAAYSHLQLHDDPAVIGSIPSSTPTPFTVDDIRASYKVALGRFVVRPFMDWSRWKYDAATLQGARVPQQGRDRDVLQAGASGRVTIGERRDLVASVSMTQSSFTRPDPGAPPPDSRGVQALGGVDWEANGTLQLRALAGVQTRNYSHRGYRDRVVPVGQVAAAWTPSRLTTVSLTVARSLEDLAQEDPGGTVFSRAELAVSHQARRDITLQARAGVQSAEFLQLHGTQATAYAGIGAGWALNRAVRLLVDMQVQRNSAAVNGQNGSLPNDQNGPYTRYQAQAGLTMAL